MKVKAWKPSYTSEAEGLPDVLGIDDKVHLVAPTVSLKEPYPLNAAILLTIRMFEKRIPFTIEHEYQGTLLTYDGDQARGDNRVLTAISHAAQVTERLVKDAIEKRIQVAEIQQQMLAEAMAREAAPADADVPTPDIADTEAEAPVAPKRPTPPPPPKRPASPPPPPPAPAPAGAAQRPAQPVRKPQPPKNNAGLKDLGLLK